MHRKPDFAYGLGVYADQSDDTPDTDPVSFEVPEDLSGITDEALGALHEQAVTLFDNLFGAGTGLGSTELDALAALTDGIEQISAETGRRDEAQAERDTTAAELAARIRPAEDAADEDADAEDDDADAEDDDAGDDADDQSDGVHIEVAPVDTPVDTPVEGRVLEPVAAAASRRGPLRVSIPRRVTAPRPTPAAAPATSMRDVVLAAGDLRGFTAGEGLSDWNTVGTALDRRLSGFNAGQYAHAAQAGSHIREQHGVLTLRKPFTDDLTITSDSVEHVQTVLDRAALESRLPGGSLTAAGGWCAPSETVYDLCELESRDGLYSLPEINISRGGISWTAGPDFASLFGQASFCVTEAQDIAGEYAAGAGTGDPNVVGDKPCFRMPCPDFSEARLNVCGLCLTAGLLEVRGFPELLARTVRGSLIAHDHRMSAALLNAVVAGSTAVSMGAGQVGAAAPVLSAIELQAEHYRASTRLARAVTLEAVFPFWVRGAFRADLSRRLGVDLLSVTDAQIQGWFTERGVAPQFVYDWQDVSLTGAGSFTSWPASVKFLLYAGGTWVKGGGEVITLDTIYDSVLLGQNDFTALFTEESWLAVKRCHDSRVVTVPLCPSGHTAAGVGVDCAGVAVPGE